MDKTAIRDAATVILWRSSPSGPEVLMGQRGANAAFMPAKYVFPGGAVDAADASVPLATALPKECAKRLTLHPTSDVAAHTLAAAAIRELWEETGLTLGNPGHWAHPPADVDHDWSGFAARGLCPTASGMKFIFRAITPPGRARRFDARFFLVSAEHIAGNVNDFSAASDELSHLHWIGLDAVRNLDLPFITEVVLAEVGCVLRDGPQAAGVPFFDNSGMTPTFKRLA
ncbi:MAG: 8-oxo-dGTP pyrophosphatase MutT (NUDIX family) [Pseudorhodobacter sp.]|jgi:8-oxo-dGTP pyrophosphatase MutT (NUDIX family)